MSGNTICLFSHLFQEAQGSVQGPSQFYSQENLSQEWGKEVCHIDKVMCALQLLHSIMLYVICCLFRPDFPAHQSSPGRASLIHFFLPIFSYFFCFFVSPYIFIISLLIHESAIGVKKKLFIKTKFKQMENKRELPLRLQSKRPIAGLI